jgi:signal transduction histidine kinase
MLPVGRCIGHQPIGWILRADRLMRHVRACTYGSRVNTSAIAPTAQLASGRLSSPAQAGSSPALRTLGFALRTLWDIVLFVLGALFSMLCVTGVPGAADEALMLTDFGAVVVLLSTALWLTVFVRRRLPALPLAAGALITLLGMDYWLLLIGAHHALVRLPRRPAFIFAGTAVALVAWAAVRDIVLADRSVAAAFFGITGNSEMPGSHVAAALVIAALALIALAAAGGSAALARTRAENSRTRRHVAAEQRRNDSLSEHLARQTERERLAREIHDALAHRLSVISLQSGALEMAAGSEQPDVARAAHLLRGQAHASLEDLRGLLGELRTGDQAASDAGVPPSQASLKALPQLVRSVRDGGTAVDAVILIEGAERAAAVFDRSIYRIVQEALTNAIKHSPGAPVSLYVEGSPGTGVRIRVMNPLAESATSDLGRTGAHSGVEGIRERARLLGGDSWVGPYEGSFLLDVALPWAAAD